MEELAFTLIIVARKLRPNFQAHTIVVQMEKPLQKTMDDPNAVGRLVLWPIELSEFNFIMEFIMGKTDD